MLDEDALENEIKSDERRFQAYSRACQYANGVAQLDHELNVFNWLGDMRKLARRIASTGTAPFTRTRAYNRDWYKLSPVGRALWTAIKIYDEIPSEFIEAHEFNPYLTVMLRALNAYAAKIPKDRGDYPRMIEPGTRGGLVSIVSFVRRACRSKRFRQMLKHHREARKKNYKSCCQYVANKFERDPCLLFLRIYLYRRPAARKYSYTRAAQHDLGRFLRDLRDQKVVPDMRGWVLRREAAVYRGLYFHLVVILDGHNPQPGENLSKQIGEAWIRKVGPSASYFVCKKEYRYNRLGIAHCQDRGKLLGVREALRSITNETWDLKPSLIEPMLAESATKKRGLKQLRKGSSRQQQTNRGAPRDVSSTLAVVEDVLLRPFRERRRSSRVSPLRKEKPPPA